MSVFAVSKSTDEDDFSKTPQQYIYLLENRGVQDDKHCCSPSSSSSSSKPKKSSHSSSSHTKSTAPKSQSNLRQVHLIPAETFQTLAQPDKNNDAYAIYAGNLGENITTYGVDLTHLSVGTRLRFKDTPSVTEINGDRKGPIIKITEFRYVGEKMERFAPGISERFVKKDGVRMKPVGVYGVVEREGYVAQGQTIKVEKSGR